PPRRGKWAQRLSYNWRATAAYTLNRPFSMFDQLTERLGRAINSLRGRGRISAENVAATLREVRMALLEADVALPVVKRFTEAVQARALGTEVASSLSPGQA